MNLSCGVCTLVLIYKIYNKIYANSCIQIKFLAARKVGLVTGVVIIGKMVRNRNRNRLVPKKGPVPEPEPPSI